MLVDDDTTILRLGEPVELDEVKRGDRILAFGERKDEDTVLTQTIIILAGKRWDEN